MSLKNLNEPLDAARQMILNDAVKDAMFRVLYELPRANDMSLVRRIITEHVSEGLELGERDRERLSKAAVSHVRAALQLKESTNRVIYGD